MYYQHRKPPRKRAKHYVMPFIIVLLLIAIIIFGWQALSNLFIGSNQNVNQERAFLEIENGSAKAMTVGKGEWVNAPDQINLYDGERLKTGADGRVSLTFFDESVARLDTRSEVAFKELSSKKGAIQILLELKDGSLWNAVKRINNPNASFAVSTDLIKVDSRGGIFSVSYPGTVHMIEGFAQVDIMDEKDVIKTLTVGVGQTVTIDEEIVSALKNEENPEILVALDEEFKSSDWYLFNMRKDGLVEDEASEEGDIEEGDEEVLETDDSATDETDETEVVEDTEEEEDPIDPNDNTPPAAPVIKEPGAAGESVTLEDIEAIITGSVSSDTYAVIVNDYKLSKFKQGDSTFSYFAKVAYNNLEPGENEYKVVAEDKAGNKSEPVTITLVLPQDVYDEKKAELEQQEEVESTTPTATNSGGVKITSPNNGENLETTETSFVIEGEVPKNTDKVIVNGYTLQAYESGSTSFTYRASSTLGNLEIGAKNTYTAKAYDDSDTLIGQASITIDVESGIAGAPTITIPTSDGTYTTTLSEVVVGGATGKWLQKVYVNGELLNSYVPGSEKWSKAITLSPGENTVTVQGESDGQKTPSVSIKIILE